MSALRIVVAGLLCALSACAGAPDPPPSSEAGRSTVVDPKRQVATRDGIPIYRRELLFEVFEIDRIYPSMRGPSAKQEMTLGDPGEKTELLWIVAYDAVVTEADGATPLSQEFMCHSNVSLLRRERFLRFLPTGMLPNVPHPRLFSLAQGQLSIRLPEGFGVPILSDQPLGLDAQVLNHNIHDRAFELRQRLGIEFIRDADLERPLTPLLPRGVFGVKVVGEGDGYPGFSSDEIDEEEHGPGCLAGIDADGGLTHGFGDDFGRELTGFWVLPPGREINRTPATKLLDLTTDTTIHYIAAHVHPFAESVTLRDLTTGEAVWTSRARQAEGKVGVAEIEHFSSVEGLPLYKDHAYELESVYDNTSGVDRDAMATLFLYLRADDLDADALRPPEGLRARRRAAASGS